MANNWLMGALAAQDQYNPEEGAYQADLRAAEQPALTPRLDPGIRRAPGDVAMRPAAETVGQVVGDLVIPQDPLDYAAMFALGPLGKTVSKGARAGALAMGGVLGLSDEAQANPFTKYGTRIVKYAKRQPEVVEDPWHGFSGLRTGKPVHEMDYRIQDVPQLNRPIASLDELLGKELIFTPGDRGAGGGLLTHVGGTKLQRPAPLEGGADYPFLHAGKPIPGQEGASRMWANAPGASTSLVRQGREVLERGREPMLMFQTMGKRSGDSSKQVALPAIDLAQQASVSNAAARSINAAMEGMPGFPGFRSKRLADWADTTSGTARGQLVKAMDTSVARQGGVPDLGELRYATTDPRLRSTPTGSAGLTVSKFDPQRGRVDESLHSTYGSAVAGPTGEAKTLGTSLPWHVAAPDIHRALMRQGDPVRFAERPDYYMAGRIPEGVPKTQVVNQQWLDNAYDWLKKNPQGWAVPAGAMGALAATGGEAEAGSLKNIVKGIKAYHSSPHDFEKFDASKIGTGEGAQVYGHGLYFAENPAVSGQGGEYWNQFLNRFPEGEREAAEQLRAHGFSRNATAETIQRQIDELQRRVDPGGVFDKPHTADARKRTHDFISELSAERDRLLGGQPVGPRTYEVNIRADPAQMLDWDKPLAQMSPEVQEKLHKSWLAHRDDHAKQSGASIYSSALQQHYPRLSTGEARARASESLAEAGIPGIKYLDQGSRVNPPRPIWHPTSEKWQVDTGPNSPRFDTKTEAEAFYNDLLAKTPQTSNYVVFDPNIVDIMKKYGIAGAAAPMGALAAQDEYR